MQDSNTECKTVQGGFSSSTYQYAALHIAYGASGLCRHSAVHMAAASEQEEHGLCSGPSNASSE